MPFLRRVVSYWRKQVFITILGFPPSIRRQRLHRNNRPGIDILEPFLVYKNESFLTILKSIDA